MKKRKDSERVLSVSRIICFMLIIILCSCSQLVWVHPEHQDRLRFINDRDQCSYQARESARIYAPRVTKQHYSDYKEAIITGAVQGISEGIVFTQEFMRCMQLKGYVYKVSEISGKKIDEIQAPTSYARYKRSRGGKDYNNRSAIDVFYTLDGKIIGFKNIGSGVKSGLDIGDRIVSVNGKRWENMSDDEKMDWVYAEKTDHISIIVVREGKNLELMLFKNGRR